MSSNAAAKAPRAHLHSYIDARLFRGIKQVALDENTKIVELLTEILEPEIDRRLMRKGRETLRPK